MTKAQEYGNAADGRLTAGPIAGIEAKAPRCRQQSMSRHKKEWIASLRSQ